MYDRQLRIVKLLLRCFRFYKETIKKSSDYEVLMYFEFQQKTHFNESEFMAFQQYFMEIGRKMIMKKSKGNKKSKTELERRD